MKRVGLVLAMFFLFCASSLSYATPLSPDTVPPSLKPWIGWVMHGHEERRCPPPYDDQKGTYLCAWPTHLWVDATNKKGSFKQEWDIRLKQWVPIPGSKKQWPQQVLVDDKLSVVVIKKGVPGVVLQPGKRMVSGSFVWDSIPEHLKVPVNSGFVTLNVDSQTITFPELDLNGRLWLHRKPLLSDKKEDANRLEITVHRKIIDTIPLKLETRIQLEVAGKDREIFLDQPLTSGWIPMRIEGGGLPVRIEENGRLRIKVKTGQWNLILTQRHLGPLSRIELPMVQEERVWSEQEIWVFEAKSQFRQVALKGALSIDPQQTTLPSNWRNYPTFLLTSGEGLNLVEEKRGDSEPQPDRLILDRQWFLDFDGGGYTLQDTIRGTLNRSWRLEMAKPIQPGRVNINGSDQFITRLPDGHGMGVEVRQGDVKIQADSRLSERVSKLPAVGWIQDFHKLSAVLHLPPGWRVFHVSGVDQVHATWLNRWTLLDLFFTFMSALAIGKLWGRSWGGLAFLTMVLTYQENPDLAWPLVHFLAASGLLRVAPDGWFRKGATLYRGVSLLSLLIVIIPFMVHQARLGIYPQLEKQGYFQQDSVGQNRMNQRRMAADKLAPMEMQSELKEMQPQSKSRVKRAMLSASPERAVQYTSKSKGYSRKQKQQLLKVDPDAKVQTGPGLPHWRWHQVSLSWNGPVRGDQTFDVILMPPGINRVLAFLRVFLLAGLFVRLLDVPLHFDRWKEKIAPTALILFLMVMGVFLPGESTASDIPSKALLKQLEERLLEPMECLPQCAQVPRLHLDVFPKSLRIRMEIHAAQEVAVPLPGLAGGWLPSQIVLDGKPPNGLMREKEGRFLIVVPQGQHHLILDGKLPSQPQIQIPFHLNPGQVTSQVEGWVVEGIQENGQTKGSIVLTRPLVTITPVNGTQEISLASTSLPPLIKVERTLVLGVTWSVETHVQRLTPLGSTEVINIPLLPGEAVTTPGIQVKKNRVESVLSSKQRALSWSSVLTQTDQIVLKASSDHRLIEVWHLQVSPIWHVDLSGIPMILRRDSSGENSPQWHPWSGEEINIKVTRPMGIPGSTLTLDRSELTLNPGLRATDLELSLVLRSSRGGRHRINLPVGVELLSVTINGRRQPMGKVEEGITLALVPGVQTVKILWRDAQGMDTLFKTPILDLGLDGVNAHLTLKLPKDRWLLAVGGPPLGPAILFWGMMLVMLLAAVGLGKLSWIPLGVRSWLLLSLGLASSLSFGTLLLVAWFLVMGQKGLKPKDPNQRPNRLVFNVRQILLVLLTFVAVGVLYESIQQGLLGVPDMQVSGNGSSGHYLKWYQDRFHLNFPQAWVITLPILAYRLMMLAWALWLATAILKWAGWGWSCFSYGGIWQGKQTEGEGFWQSIVKKKKVPSTDSTKGS